MKERRPPLTELFHTWRYSFLVWPSHRYHAEDPKMSRYWCNECKALLVCIQNNEWLNHPSVRKRKMLLRVLTGRVLLFHREKSDWYLHRRMEIEFRSKSPILPWSNACPDYPSREREREQRITSIRFLLTHKPHPKGRIVFLTFLKIPWKRFCHHVSKSLEPVLHLDDRYPTKRWKTYGEQLGRSSLTLITWPVRGLITRKILSLHEVTMREPL